MANEFKVKKGLIVNGEGGTVVDIQGESGQLFSVTDSLTGVLMSVNDISGIPIFEVYSDDTIRMGPYGNPFIINTSGLFANANQVIDSSGNVRFDGTPTTTNQNRGIYWTAYDKEGTTDPSDSAYIRHTTNSGGLTGSVLEISSQNDAGDGVNFLVNSSANGVRINGNAIWHAGNLTNLNQLTNGPGYTTNTGTVTSVSGTGSVSGLTLSGTVTSSGSLTLGGTLSLTAANVNAVGAITNSTSGNAATATALQTTRSINGTDFNGSASITTANWGTARTLTIGNTGKSVNGSANVAWTLAEIGAYAATNPSGYATTGYVDTAVAELVDTAPDSLNTLRELAAALGEDPNFATTVTTSLGNRLRVDINNQGLNGTQQANGRTNLGLGTAATSNTGAFAAASHTHADATTSASGFMSAADKTKLNGVATGATANTGTVTSVSGTGNVSGLTLSGSVTSSGSLTLGGTLSLTAANVNAVGAITNSTSGNAATATNATTATFVSSPDGDRVAGNKLPTSNPRSVRFDFATASSVTGSTGNYAGVMTYAPWDGTSASTGDSSYQLAFANQSGVNASGPAQLLLRNGINSTWNSWQTMLSSSNFNSYSPTLTGGGASGTWGINITGNAATATTLAAARTLTIGSTGKTFNGGAAVSWTLAEIGAQAAGSYAAASHTHTIAQVTGLQTALDGKAASSHTHAIDEITGLPAALDGKQAAGSYAAASHTHTIAQVTGLQTALDGKQAAGSYAAASHTHTIANVTGLQGALDGKLSTAGKAADSELLDGIDSTGFVRQLGDTNTPDYLTTSSRRVDPNTANPTNEHYAVTTFGNGGNVNGQLATHFVTGNLYSRGHNSTWSAWRRYWNDTDFTSTNISNWNAAFGWGNHAGLYAAVSHTHTIAQVTGLQTALDGKAASSHTHTIAQVTGLQTALDGKQAAGSYLPTAGGNITGSLTISGSETRGTYTALSNYHSGADNLVLKGNASGISSIFFESEKDATNINHPSDFGFIQFHSYGTGTSGESNELIIGVSNDADDHVVINAPDVNGFKFRVGAAETDYTVWHSGNFDPGSYAAVSHTHTIANVTGLQGALDGKQAAGSYAAASHTHTIAQVTGLQTALDGKAASAHTHAIDEITGLPAALDGKQAAGSYAAASHTHAASDITSGTLASARLSGTYAISISGNAATATSADQIDGVAFRNTGSNAGVNADTLDSNGITYYTSGVTNFSGNATDGALYSQAYSSAWQHQIAGDYRSGQIALRGKNSGTWQAWRTVLDSGNFSTWAAAASHTHTIAQVTGLQTALDGKAASSHTHTIAQVTGLQTALDGKAASSHTHAIDEVTGLQAELDGKQAAGSYLTTSGKAADANLLDGLDLHTGRNNEANKVVRTQANGYVDFGWINTTSGNTTSTLSDIYVNTNDGYIRKATPAHFRSQITDGVYAAVSHTHTIAQVTGLQTALDGKQAAGSYAAASHTHTIANVTGLQAALDGKQAAGSYAAASHEHDRTFITDSRGAARAPSYYDDRYAQWDFQNNSDTGAGGDSWHGLLTVAKWTVYDASHRQEQLAFTGDDLKRRTSASDTTWGAWKTILDSTNFSTWAAAASHTHTPSQVGLGNVSNNAQVTTINNTSLNDDSRNRNGVTRLYRRDDNSDYSVQTHWTGQHWYIGGYFGDGFHAEARVGYADSAGSAAAATSATNSTNANRLDNFGINYGSAWNTWGITNKLVASSFHAASGANMPPTYNYGSFLSFINSGSDQFQIAIPENQFDVSGKQRAMHYRSGWNGGWSSWRQVVDIQNNVCAIVADQTSSIIVAQGVGYNQRYDSNIEIHGSVDEWAYGKFRFRVQDEEGIDPVYGAQFRIERHRQSTGWELLGMVPRNSPNLEWQGDIFSGLSDQRVKENVTALANSLQTVQQINAVSFDWKPVEGISERTGHDIGFIAQELELIMPTAVHTRSDGYKTVKYEKVVPVLVQAIKDQQSLIEQLTAKVDALESR